MHDRGESKPSFSRTVGFMEVVIWEGDIPRWKQLKVITRAMLSIELSAAVLYMCYIYVLSNILAPSHT